MAPNQCPPIRVSIVGCGAVAELFYAPALRALEDAGLAKVVMLVDPSRDRMAHLRRNFPEAATLIDAKQLEGGERDLAIIASPVRFHAEHAINALKAGFAVLCEKPMAATVAQAEAMVEQAAVAGKVLAIGLFRRFFPATATIHDLLASGALGSTRSFHFSEGVNFNWPAQSPSFFKRESGGGGVLIDIGAHDLDLLLWWFGTPSKLDYEDDAMGGVEANCRLALTFASGVTGEMRLSRDWPLANRCVIECERGTINWAIGEAEQLQIKFNESQYTLDGKLCEPAGTARAAGRGAPGPNFNQSFINQLRNVFAAIHGKESVRVSGETALKSLQCIERCYQNRLLMPLPWLSRREYEAARKLASVEGLL